MADMPRESSFSKMADYLLENYLSEDEQFPPNVWAWCKDRATTTNKPCESFHAHFSDSFYRQKTNITIFVNVLISYQCSVYIKMQSLNIQPL